MCFAIRRMMDPTGGIKSPIDKIWLKKIFNGLSLNFLAGNSSRNCEDGENLNKNIKVSVKGKKVKEVTEEVTL